MLVANRAVADAARIDKRTDDQEQDREFSMQTFDSDVQNRIIKLVKGILEQNSLAAEVTRSARLVDIGLTSMDMVNLMLGVEAEFDFTIPQAEITPENFQSVDTLQRMVVNQLRPVQAA
jgi:acyl carrier protein